MYKKTGVLIAFYLLLLTSLSAQQADKMNASLRNELGRNSDHNLDVLIKGDIASIKKYLETNGGLLKYAYGNIASISIPSSKITDLCQQKSVQRIELRSKGLRPLDDSSISKNNIAKIHSGAAPLVQAYTGNGVVVGIIDTGIDPFHKDFRDTSGKSRIKFLWDQNDTAQVASPQPYNYGIEWTNVQIDSGLCTFDDHTSVGHGSKVAGVAAGNGNTAPQYKGIAPNADIITVAIDFFSTGPVISDAVNYIFSKADTLGKPCVINISLGDYYGSHDGLDLETQMIEGMTANIPGRAIVAAAGNSGDVPIHLGYSVNAADTNFTWFSNSTNQVYLQFYADTADLKNIQYTIGISDTSFVYKGNVGFNTVDSCMNTMVTDTLQSGGNRFGLVQTYCSLSSPGAYLLEVMITPDSLSYLWSFETTGTGKFDCWSPDIVYYNLPASSLLPRMVYYKNSDTLQTICTGFQCSNEVITVGNGTARNSFLNAMDSISVFPGVNDSIFPTSSLGPTRDGRIKPDIVSTGENIVTAGSLGWLWWLSIHFPDVVTYDSLHMIFGGTSAASPVVAGFVALYLEKNPTATNQMIKQDIINCARQDNFTGPVPNNLWGYGKLDGFNAMLCSSPVSTGPEKNSESLYQVFPNPAHNQLTISAKQGTIDMIRMYDAQGKIVLSRKSNQETTETLRMDHLPEGLYIVCITNAKGDMQRFKIIRQN